MNTVIRKIGNSEGVILPKETLTKLNLKAGDSVEITESDGKLTLSPVDYSFERQMEAARKVMDRYKVALQKLAE